MSKSKTTTSVAEPPAELSVTALRQIQKRDQIIDAALLVFTRDGFAAARTDSIAKQAGVAKGTLYLYFDSKEDIFKQAIRDRLLPVVDEMERLSGSLEGSAEQLLRMQIGRFYERVIGTELRQILRLMLAEGTRFPDIAAFYFDNVISRGMASIRSTVEYGIRTGEFRRPEGHQYPLTIAGPALMSGIWKMVFDHCEPLDLEQMRDTHVDMVLHALRKT